VCENRVLRRIFGPQREEVERGWRRLHDEELHYLYSRVRFPAGAGNFSLHHCVQNGSEAHPASYPMGTRDSFPVS